MARLTRKQISDLVELLAEWRTPDELANVVDDTMDRLGSDDLFNQGGLAFLRDARIAAEFSKIRQAHQVRLVADDWPDFEIKIEGHIEAFEAVEADDPDRRRGDEYRTQTALVEDDPVEDWIERASNAPAWIEAACRKKANKRYGARANLVVFLNLSEYGIRQKEIEGCFLAASESVKDHFDTVWVLWKTQVYPVWKDGTENLSFS